MGISNEDFSQKIDFCKFLEGNKSETIVTSPDNNNLISPKDLSKSQDLNPANSRMGRRKQVAPQKAAGTDGRTQLFDMHFCLFAQGDKQFYAV